MSEHKLVNCVYHEHIRFASIFLFDKSGRDVDNSGFQAESARLVNQANRHG